MIVDYDGSLVPAEQVLPALLGSPTALGDGVYETLRTYNGRLFGIDSHLRRLERSAQALHLPMESTRNVWKQRLDVLHAANSTEDAELRVRIVVQRKGTAPLSDNVTTSIMAWPIQQAELDAKRSRGLAAVLASERRVQPGNLFGHKTLNLLHTAAAQREASEAGADEAFVCNTGDEVCEATYSNIFVVTNGEIITPPLSAPCLPGITRMHVMSLLERAGRSVTERPVLVSELASADEVFLTSSVSEIMPVTLVNHRGIRDGKTGAISRLLQEQYRILAMETPADTSG